MFGTILISAVTLMQLYVLWCVWSVPAVRRHFSGRSYIGLGLLLWVTFLIGRMYGHDGHGLLAMLGEFLAMTWLGTLLLMMVSLLVVDAITLFGLLLRRHVSMLRGLARLTGTILTTAALVQGIRPPVIQDYELQIGELPIELEGTRIAVLSDLHLGSLLGREWLEARITQTLALRPDMVLLLGDILEGHGMPDQNLLPALRRLTAPLGVWAILGNHEFHGEPDATIAFMEKAGFKILRNRWVELHPGLVLTGWRTPPLAALRTRTGDPSLKC